MRVKHTWDTVPVNWESLGPPFPGTTIDLRIALKPHRENALIDSLYGVSTPKHPKYVSITPLCTHILTAARYGAHLSQEQVADLVAPHPDTLELVKSWLKHFGVPSSSFSMIHTGNWLKVTGVPVSQANELLGATYELYRHAETNNTILRTISYALPAALESHVQTVVPTTYFGSESPRTLRKTPHMRPGGAAAVGAPRGVTSRDDEDIEPEYLRWLYYSIA
jgi:tripeptidyl-peptidase-1